MILSKAASTAVDGAVLLVVEPFGACGAGELSGFADLVAAFCGGEGLGSTVRVRLEGEVLLFWANARTRLTNTTEITATDLFIIQFLQTNLNGSIEIRATGVGCAGASRNAHGPLSQTRQTSRDLRPGR